MVIPQNMIQQAMTHSHIIIIIYIYIYVHTHIIWPNVVSYLYSTLYPTSFIFQLFSFPTAQPWTVMANSASKYDQTLNAGGLDFQNRVQILSPAIGENQNEHIYIYIIYIICALYMCIKYYICALNIIYMYTMWIIMDNWDSKSATTRIQSEHSWIYSPVITRVLL